MVLINCLTDVMFVMDKFPDAQKYHISKVPVDCSPCQVSKFMEVYILPSTVCRVCLAVCSCKSMYLA